MPHKSDSESLAALLGAAAEADPEIRNRVKRLITGMLEHAEHTMRWGTPADKAALMRAAIPAMMRSLQRTEEDAVVKAQREALARMYSELTGGRT